MWFEKVGSSGTARMPAIILQYDFSFNFIYTVLSTQVMDGTVPDSFLKRSTVLHGFCINMHSPICSTVLADKDS